MTQLHFTLSKDLFIGLFKAGHEEGFSLLMTEILTQFLDAESEHKLQAKAHERNDERTDYRNGKRDRTVKGRIGRLILPVPRHRNEPFHSTLLDCYQRNEQALIATMMEMVVQGVSTRKVEEITRELCGIEFSKSHISDICKHLDKVVLAFKNRPLETDYPFVMVDAMYIKVREHAAVRSKALLVALGINPEGRKEIIGFDVCEGESEYHWESFFLSLKERGLRGLNLITSDQHAGLVAAIRSVFQNVAWQRCQFHFTRNILDSMPKKYKEEVSRKLKIMFNEESIEAARAVKNDIIDAYQSIAPRATETLDEGFEDAMNVMCLPLKYRITLRTSNLLERENQELRRRESVIRIFPNVASATRLMGAVLLDHHEAWSMKSRVFNMDEYYAKQSEFQTHFRMVA